jgi:hypothetical protein
VLVCESKVFYFVILESHHCIHEAEALKVSIERELCFNSNGNTLRVTDVNKLNVLESLKSVRKITENTCY